MPEASNPAKPPVLATEKVSKRFGSFWANRGVTIDFGRGEIHAVVGENGAGKSTLMKILYGQIRPDAGTVYHEGKAVRFRRPREALRAGIGMVYQQLLVFPQLTALENVIVGSEPETAGFVKKEQARKTFLELSARFGFDLPPDENAGNLSFAKRQQIELLRVLYRESGILILDEPTSLLAPLEVRHLLDLLKSLRESGHTIILISHRLSEVFEVADRISVLRRGKLIHTCAISDTSPEKIANLIVSGEDTEAPEIRTPLSAPAAASGRPYPVASGPLAELSGISTESSGSEAGLEGLSLRIDKGEMLGMGGIVGNGLSALARVIYGIARPGSGSIRFQDREISHLSIEERIRCGLRWLPPNPLEEALLPERSVAENLLLGFQRDPLFQKMGFLKKGRINLHAGRQLEIQKVAYRDLSQPVASLSGGNQQKVALGRVLSGSPQFVIMEQPGRGLDIKAQRRLARRLRTLNASGITFLILSYDLDELLSLSDRIGVLYRGRLMGMASRGTASRETLGRWMLGLKDPEQG